MQVHSVWSENIRVALTAAGVAGGNVEKDRDRPTKASDLPICLIAVVKDTAQADGDPRHGSPSFAHTTELVVGVQDRAATGPELRQNLYAVAELVCESLLTDLNAWGGVDGDGVEYLEGIARVDTSYNLPPEGQDVMGAVEIKFHLLHRTLWAQRLPADAGDLATVSIGVEEPEGTPQPGITIAVPQE